MIGRDRRLHVCRVVKVSRRRQTGWLVECQYCGNAPTVSRTKKQAERLKFEHEESRRLAEE